MYAQPLICSSTPIILSLSLLLASSSPSHISTPSSHSHPLTPPPPHSLSLPSHTLSPPPFPPPLSPSPPLLPHNTGISASRNTLKFYQNCCPQSSGTNQKLLQRSVPLAVSGFWSSPGWVDLLTYVLYIYSIGIILNTSEWQQ